MLAVDAPCGPRLVSSSADVWIVPAGVDSRLAVAVDPKIPSWVGGSNSAILYKSKSMKISKMLLWTTDQVEAVGCSP